MVYRDKVNPSWITGTMQRESFLDYRDQAERILHGLQWPKEIEERNTRVYTVFQVVVGLWWYTQRTLATNWAPPLPLPQTIADPQKQKGQDYTVFKITRWRKLNFPVQNRSRLFRLHSRILPTNRRSYITLSSMVFPAIILYRRKFWKFLVPTWPETRNIARHSFLLPALRNVFVSPSLFSLCLYFCLLSIFLSVFLSVLTSFSLFLF